MESFQIHLEDGRESLYSGGVKALVPGGLLVAVEGIDGAGKTSISTLLAQWCGERGLYCTISKEPTGLKWGQELRKSAKEGRLTLEEELRLFELDRRDHIARSIQPALDGGGIVILDRYYWSTAAYQGARGANVADIMARHGEFAPTPDLVLVLDVTTECGLSRIRGRGDKPNLFEDATALDKAAGIFRELPLTHVCGKVIPAGGDLKDCFQVCLATFQKAYVEKLVKGGLKPEMVDVVLEFFGGTTALDAAAGLEK